MAQTQRATAVGVKGARENNTGPLCPPTRAPLVSVQSFQRVVDEGSKEKRWFPATLLNGPTTIVFEKVRLNPELPDSTFSPPLPPGTQLHTGRMVLDPISNRMVPEVIVIGGEEGKRVLARRQAKLREEGARIEWERAQQPPDP